MASLKELKTRINSVTSTKKITSAMKMIASSKLHRAQAAITSFLPYQKKLDAILNHLLSADLSYNSPYTDQRDVKRVAIVVFASNSSLCGAFNANIIKEFSAEYAKWNNLGKENILVYPIGKKVGKAIQKRQIPVEGDYKHLMDKPSFEETQYLAKEIIDKYLKKEIDRVILIYHHFISMGSQKMINTNFLPFALEKSDDSKSQVDYIFEPSKEDILNSLIPTVLYSKFYAALLDSSASEHAARTIAMQIATDNADDLNTELKILFNKTRQQTVTNELLDIIGGASALQK